MIHEGEGQGPEGPAKFQGHFGNRVSNSFAQISKDPKAKPNWGTKT